MSELEELKKRAARLRQQIPAHMHLLPQVREAVAIIEGLIKVADKGAGDAKAEK